ncbi:MAG TPA: hypothetical protein DDX19_26490 [Rhodopirellula baltica]|nr:hypothetical protein [Rhodopirellula baltica]
MSCTTLAAVDQTPIGTNAHRLIVVIRYDDEINCPPGQYKQRTWRSLRRSQPFASPV